MAATIEEIRQMCIDIAHSQGETIICPIALNKRLKKTLGRVCYDWDNYEEGTIKPKIIEFSANFVECAAPDELRDVVRHEMAHYLVSMKTHQKHGHDKTFAKMCEAIGGSDAIAHPHIATAYEKNFKYKVYCKECGSFVAGYYRAGKVVQHPDWYRCPLCHGEIRVEQEY